MFAALLKFLLVAILILWILRMVARLIFPWAMKKAAEKIMSQQPYSPNQGPKQRSQSKAPEGTIHIDYVPPKAKEGTGPQRAGDFVEFEEVR
jgi:hypothetical protein